MSSGAPVMLQALRAAVASLTPSTYAGPQSTVGLGDGATAFHAVGSLREFENGGAQSRDFLVTLNPGDAHQTTMISGYTGRGSFILRAFVMVRHIADGMDETDFHSVVADDHRIICDGVERYMMAAGTAPSGIGMCVMDGGVSFSADTKGSTVDSIIPFRIDYDDSLQ